jgi:hypothetical protein
MAKKNPGKRKPKADPLSFNFGYNVVRKPRKNKPKGGGS